MFDHLVFVEADSPQARRRRTSTAVSIAVQATLVLIIALVPLLRVDPPPPMSFSAKAPDFMPQIMRLLTREDVAHSAAFDRSVVPEMTAVRSRALRVPTDIPSRLLRDDGDAPYINNPCPTCAVGAGMSSLNNMIGANPAGPVIVHQPETPRIIRVRVSHVDEAQLLRKVQPEYPAAAKLAGIQGQVVLRATISTSGTVEALQVVSGHPFLVGAAVDAVRQWRYRPLLLNDRAVEVETEITVKFTIGQAQ